MWKRTRKKITSITWFLALLLLFSISLLLLPNSVRFFLSVLSFFRRLVGNWYQKSKQASGLLIDHEIKATAARAHFFSLPAANYSIFKLAAAAAHFNCCSFFLALWTRHKSNSSISRALKLSASFALGRNNNTDKQENLVKKQHADHFLLKKKKTQTLTNRWSVRARVKN